MTNSSVLESSVPVAMPRSDIGDQPATRASAPPPRFSQNDATELAARRAADAKLESRLHGWKPLTMWYALWAIAIAIGGISSLASGQVGAFFLAGALCGACTKYAHYLYHGGRRRVWFFIW